MKNDWYSYKYTQGEGIWRGYELMDKHTHTHVWTLKVSVEIRVVWKNLKLTTTAFFDDHIGNCTLYHVVICVVVQEDERCHFRGWTTGSGWGAQLPYMCVHIFGEERYGTFTSTVIGHVVIGGNNPVPSKFTKVDH